MTNSNSNVHYASKFLGVENLHESYELPEAHTLHVTQIRRMIVAIAAEKDKSISPTDVDNLIYANLWDKEDGLASAQGSDTADLHVVGVTELNALINAVKKL